MQEDSSEQITASRNHFQSGLVGRSCYLFAARCYPFRRLLAVVEVLDVALCPTWRPTSEGGLYKGLDSR
jgi:hypothetical protein